MAAHYFVWYRVPGDAAAARASVNALMHDITRGTGVIGRLLMRHVRAAGPSQGANCAPSGGVGDVEVPPTWMEVYECVADADTFEAAYAQATARHAVAAHAPEGRHLERFLDAP